MWVSYKLILKVCQGLMIRKNKIDHQLEDLGTKKLAYDTYSTILTFINICCGYIIDCIIM